LLNTGLNARIDAWLVRFLRSLALVVAGVVIIVSATATLAWNEHLAVEAAGEASLSAWAMRGAGLVAMVVGFGLLTGPVRVVAGIVPVFASIVRFGTALLAGASGLSLSVVAIAVPWAFYSLGLSLGILLVGFLAVTVIVHLGIYIGVRIANAREAASAMASGD
jgi:uncharacterized membrane protein YfcA